MELQNLPLLVVGQFLFLRCRPLERNVPIKGMADSQFAAIFLILANRVGELRNLSMSARNLPGYRALRSPPQSGLLETHDAVEDRYFANGSELFQLCEPLFR